MLHCALYLSQLDREKTSPDETHPVRGGDRMSEQEKRTAEKLADALNALPEDKKDRLLAYAEGMAAMADRDRVAEKGK